MFYQENRKWADEYMPKVIGILGEMPSRYFGLSIGIATDEEDIKQATDLKVLSIGNKKIGVRIRRAETYMERWGGQFTIRSMVYYGGPTEIHKIAYGWGNIFFYGFGDEHGDIVGYHVIDLSGLRKHIRISEDGRSIDTDLQCPLQYVPGIPSFGGTEFYAFEVATLPEGIVIRSTIVGGYGETEISTPATSAEV